MKICCLAGVGAFILAATAAPAAAQDCGTPVWTRPFPEGRSRPQAAFDAGEGVTYFYGGGITFEGTSDLWSYGAQGWRRLSTGLGPGTGTLVCDGTAGRPMLLSVSSGNPGTWRWDGQSWRQVDGSPRHLYPGVAYDSVRGRVVLFGGINADGATREWNGTEWEVVATAGPPARYGHGMCYDAARQRVVLFGGTDATTPRGDTWTFDGTEWTQLNVAGPSPRSGQLTYNPVTQTCVLSGGNSAETWEWDGAAWVQRLATGGPVRTLPGTAMGWDQSLLLFGGTGTLTSQGEVWAWDGAAWTQRPWTAIGDRSFAQMVYDARRGRCLLHDGFRTIPETWGYDGLGWVRLSTGGPRITRESGMAYDSRRGVVVAVAPGQGRLDTWEWDGAAWTQRSVIGPTLRDEFGMVYDSRRGVTVLYGGTAGSSETWEWNGTDWVQPQVPNAGPHASYAMAFDSRRGVAVMYGGYRPGGTPAISDQTWEYDGAAWVQRTIVGPPARDFLVDAMDYDEHRGVCVLFGGYPLSSLPAGEVWEYDGSEWTLRSQPGPLMRHEHSTAYDSGRGAFVLFGGSSGRGETWEYRVPSEPVFTEQPAAVAMEVGGEVVFTAAAGPGAMAYRWQRDGVDLENGGAVSGADTRVLRIGVVTPGHAGEYRLRATNGCGTGLSDAAGLVVTGCYANCDGSTAAPVLNVNDFTCYLNRFAAGEPYANCDGSAAAPVLNVNDFTCFLNQYAQSCP